MSAIRSLDLFSGCGGLTYGLSLSESSSSRIEAVAALDNWQAACDTFNLNFDVKARCEGVDRQTVSAVLDEVGDVDLVVGGPPCQGFSTSGKRAFDDPRNALVLAFLEAVKLAQPRAFLMENVSGFKTFQGGRVFAETVAMAEENGFRVYPGIVLASLAGVPQRRRRFILVGIREGSEFSFPNQLADSVRLFGEGAVDLVVDQRPTQGKEIWTFDDATSDLPAIEAGQSSDVYASDPRNDFQKWAREQGACLTDHMSVGHKPYFVEMMSYIPQGKSAMDPDIRELMPERLRPKSGYPNSYARIRGDQPAPTITRNFTTPSSANCIHPRLNRALSLREGARCQSFPDHFVFSGTTDEKRLQIGNAVPPLLGKALGDQLLLALSS